MLTVAFMVCKYVGLLLMISPFFAIALVHDIIPKITSKTLSARMLIYYI